MELIFYGIIFLFMLFMGFILGGDFLAASFHRATKARFQKNVMPLKLMLSHLQQHPELWSISQDSAAFPQEGAKQIYLNRDGNSWTYSLESFDRKSRKLPHYFH